MFTTRTHLAVTVRLCQLAGYRAARTAAQIRARLALVAVVLVALSAGCDRRYTADQQAFDRYMLTASDDAPTVEVPAAPVTPTVCIEPAALERDPLLTFDLEAAVLWLNAEGYTVRAGVAGDDACTISVTFGKVPEGALAQAHMKRSVIVLGDLSWESLTVEKGWSVVVIAHETWHLLTGRWDHESDGVFSPDGDLGHGALIESPRYE